MTERVRIPSDLNEEDVFFSLGPIKLSIRQLLLVIGSILIWYMVSQYLITGVFGLTMIFSLMTTCWIPLSGATLAFVRVAGRPIDIWIAEKLAYTFGPRTYLMRDVKAGRGVQADLDRDSDIEALLDYRLRDRG